MADLHFLAGDQVNPFWIPHWESRDPMDYRDDRDAPSYGPQGTGKLLSAIVGNNLCLEPFGMPSDEEVSAGATLHGEAGVSLWRAECFSEEDRGGAHFAVSVPPSALDFMRTVSLRHGESVIRVRETVTNQLDVDRQIQWQQHVTLAPPFVTHEDCRLLVPGTSGMTLPSGYEGHELLAKDAQFQWPFAPAAESGSVDLRIPFPQQGKGFVAGVQVDPAREYAYVCAINRPRRLVFGCVFRRKDFPWVTLWEENHARPAPPWSGVEETSAIEFGVSPLPIGRAETLRRGEQFGTPVMAHLPARGSIRAGYLMFLAQVPAEPERIADLACGDDELRLLDSSGEAIAAIPVRSARDFLYGKDEGCKASRA